jgi:molybdate transport system substrate-binding protein
MKSANIIFSCLTTYYCSFSLFAQRKRTKRKGTLLSRPFGLPYASRCCRDAEKLGFASDSSSVFIRQQLRCSAGQNGAPTTKQAQFSKAISRSRAAQNLPKRSLNCLSTPAGHKLREFLNFRQIRAAQGSLPSADQWCDLITRRVNGCPFWFVFGQTVNHQQFRMLIKMNVKNVKHLSKLLVIFLINILLSAGAANNASGREELRVAVATNFIRTMDAVAARYEEQTGIKIRRSSSASGILYAQIMNHAPFDLFLSADEKRPALLHQQGLCGKPFTYAAGEVVLWSGRSDLDMTRGWAETVLSDDIRRIGIPNPATAPYGEATVKTLKKQGLYEKVEPRLVYGQNVGQAFQYAQQGSADIAFAARSYVLSEHGRQGRTWQLPEAEPVIQNGCILTRSLHKESALEFAAYLTTPEAKTILSAYGYK